MARRVLIRDQALADLADISDHLCKSSRSLAERFLDAADSTFADLAKNPGLGSPCLFAHPFIADIRRWRVKKFKDYLIFLRRSGSWSPNLPRVTWSERLGDDSGGRLTSHRHHTPRAAFACAPLPPAVLHGPFGT